MSDQPKPTTDIHACDHCGNFHDPSYSDCATGEPIMPKPTTGQCTCDNASGLHWGKCPLNMKPKPTTGGWTADTVFAIGNDLQAIADAHNAALDAAWKDGFLKDKSDILEAALADEREKWIGHGGSIAGAAVEEIQQLREQLAAEREKRAKSDEFRERLRSKHHQQSDVLAESKSIIQQLREQLAAAQSRVDNCKRLELESAKAQAALKLIQDAYDNKGSIGLSDTIVSSRSSNAAALDAAIAAAQKPLVELLSLLRYDANGHITAWPNEKKFKAALAKVKETT